MVKIAILLFLLIIGYLINKYFEPRQVKEFIKYFLIYIGIPILLLYSILNYQSRDFGLIAGIIVFSLVLNIIFSQLGNKLLNLKDRGSLLLLNSFPNSGYLGLPLCWILFGDLGLYYGSLYVLVGTLIHCTLGIGAALQFEFNQIAQSIKGVGKFPGIWTLVIVLLMIAFKINFSPLIMERLGSLGKIILGLAIFYIGLNLEKPKNLREFSHQCLYVGAFRFLVSPLIIFLSLFFLKHEGWQILTFQALMPPAIANTIIAGYYRLNEKLCANVTTILTVIFLAIFFIFVWFSI
ncbi:MAG: AEC family transporter [Patescibacteria group bacterium]|nr:AEC family transporter [Patescibacteria group bacterium]